MLSEREQKILEYIETKMELDGIPPTIRELAAICKSNPPPPPIKKSTD